MVLAHALGGNGPEIELLLLGVVLVGFALMSRRDPEAKPATPIVAGIAGLALVGGSFVFSVDEGSSEAPSDVAVRIVSPQDGEEVPAGEPVDVSVELDGAELTEETSGDDPRKGHIHIFVDETLASMPTSLNNPVTLEPGEHEVAVEFVGADHSQFEPRIMDSVEVTAE